MYLNSGDWVENLTALEYGEGAWKLYVHQEEGLGVRNASPVRPLNGDTVPHSGRLVFDKPS